MDWSSIVVAVITALGSFMAVYFSNRKSSALIAYRIDQLEKKVDRHNSVIERTYQLEEGQAVMKEQIRVANHRIEDLERKGA